MTDPRIEAAARVIGHAWDKQPEHTREHWRGMAREILAAADGVDPLRAPIWTPISPPIAKRARAQPWDDAYFLVFGSFPPWPPLPTAAPTTADAPNPVSADGEGLGGASAGFGGGFSL